MKKIAFEEHYGNPFIMQLRASTKRGRQVEFPLNPQIMREISQLACDIDSSRLKSMKEASIDMQILMCASNGIEYVDDRQRAYEIAHEFNKYVYETAVLPYPDKFKAYATLPVQDAELAARELEYCVENYGFIGGVIVGFPRPDIFIDHSEFDILWACAQRLDVLLYIHPTETPVQAQHLYKDHGELLGSTWSWSVDTATCVLRMIFSGIFDRYPGLKLMMGHLGEMLPYVIRRVDERWKVTPMGAVNQKLPSEYLKHNIYLSTSGILSVPALLCAISEVGVERIVFAVDYPYETNQVFSEFIEKAPLTDAQREAICYRNAHKILKV